MKLTINEAIQRQRQQGRYRHRTMIEPNERGEIKVNGKTYLNFSSNDYLGLSQDPQLKKAMQQGVERYGMGSTGSSLITGYHSAHQALEETICEWLNKPACLLFSSGFAANSGIIQALANLNNTAFFIDKLSHASIIDGVLSTKAPFKRFLHNNDVHLAQMLHTKDQSCDPVIVSEGVFSMDGDAAPIDKLNQMAQHHRACLMIDDAHAIGVKGAQGEGSVAESNIDIIMGTFGKALGTSGAFVACDQPLHEYFVNYCRHYIYSTAIPPSIAWATKAAIELCKTQRWRREKIQALSHLFQQQLDEGITLVPSQSSIHAIIVGDENKALLASEKLKDEGIWLAPIRPPTVPKGSSRLRVTICANHNDNNIKYLAECLNKVLAAC
jgi:8-amino-7-oxononanoate synthase